MSRISIGSNIGPKNEADIGEQTVYVAALSPFPGWLNTFRPSYPAKKARLPWPMYFLATTTLAANTPSSSPF
jgi:hypothetical protein